MLSVPDGIVASCARCMGRDETPTRIEYLIVGIGISIGNFSMRINSSAALNSLKISFSSKIFSSFYISWMVEM